MDAKKRYSKEIVFSNLIWRFAERMGAQLVSFVVSVVLARLLMPEVYGKIVLTNVFIMILQVFVDSGFGNALIQKKDADELDFSSVFYINLGFCIVLYTMLFLAAPLIAGVYADPEMTWVIRVLGLTVIISGVKNIQQAYVSRKMMFRKFFFATLGGTVVSGIAGIILAYNGAGVWAVVIQQLSNAFIDTCILWVTVRWRPSEGFSFDRIKQLYSYGWKLLLSSLIDVTYNNLRSLIIGRVYSGSDLAYYDRGQRIPSLVVTNINASIDSVLLPVMSSEQDNVTRVREMCRRSVSVSTYLIAPLMLGLAAVATPLTVVLLTDKWIESVPFMRIFCLIFMLYPIHTANLNAIKALGRSDIFLHLEVIKKVIGIVALLLTMMISVKAMAYSLLFVSVINQIINAHPNKKLMDYGYTDQLKDIGLNMVLAIGMMLAVYPLSNLSIPVWTVLLVQIITGMAVYLVLSVIFKPKGYIYCSSIIKENLGR